MLHKAVLQSGAEEKLKMLLADTPDADQPAMLAGHDSTGATPIFAALRRSDTASALLLLAAVQATAASMEDCVLQGDMFGTPPLHALFGLSCKSNELVPADVSWQRSEPEPESGFAHMLAASLPSWASAAFKQGPRTKPLQHSVPF
eukprot:SAG11_NODE_2679_length_3104_cov_3.342429_2_plen_146_part_00